MGDVTISMFAVASCALYTLPRFPRCEDCSFVFELKTHLRSLVESHAPSGHEAPIRALLRDAWAGWVDEFQEDRLGSLIAIKRATRKTTPPRKIMLAAHMDEIGMMVTRLFDGFIGIQAVAGTDNRLLLAQPVLVHGREMLRGVVATVPPHLLKGNNGKYVDFPSLLIDVGLPQAEVERLVRPGDLVTLDAPMLELNGSRVAGKAMDDRACVAAVSVCLKELQRYHHAWDVYAVATVQEETGLYGAKTAAYAIQPDIAIALDLDNSVGNLYRVTALPTSFFIDRKGVIRSVIVGGPMSETVIQSKVEELLREDQ